MKLTTEQYNHILDQIKSKYKTSKLDERFFDPRCTYRKSYSGEEYLKKPSDLEPIVIDAFKQALVIMGIPLLSGTSEGHIRIKEDGEVIKRKKPDYEILSPLPEPFGRDIVIELEPIGADLESEGQGIKQVEEWFELTHDLGIRCDGLATNFIDWILYAKGESGYEKVKLNSIEAFDYIYRTYKGELNSEDTVALMKEREEITKNFFDLFETRLNWVCENPKHSTIKIHNLNECVPKELKRDVAVHYYRSIFFRMLFIRILREWELIKIDPMEYVLKAPEPFQHEFFNILFFCVFNSEKSKREEIKSYKDNPLTSVIYEAFSQMPYLNGGLFSRSEIELNPAYQKLSLSNAGYEDIYTTFINNYKFNATSKSTKTYIDPDVLGYIFERTIDVTGESRKNTGSYYTSVQITDYLSRTTTYKYLKENINDFAYRSGILSRPQEFKNFDFMGYNPVLREKLYSHLFELLQNIKICDSACGSGSFLKACANYLVEVYCQIYDFKGWQHPYIADDKRTLAPGQPFADIYSIREYILQNNLFGVDIMPNAVDICYLRMWLWLVSSPGSESGKVELKPLPNLNFNIFEGNSLIGYYTFPKGTVLSLEDAESIRIKRLQRLKKIQEFNKAHGQEAMIFEAEIKKIEEGIITLLNQSFYAQELHLKIQNKINFDDFLRLKPFHWCFMFDSVMQNGNFDIMIGNPPWNAVKPFPREFFGLYDTSITKFADKKAAMKRIRLLAKVPEISKKWVTFVDNINNEKLIYKGFEKKKKTTAGTIISESQKIYNYQDGHAFGKKLRCDINYYKLFMERNHQLTKENGFIALVVPSAFYSDGGTKNLRDLFFDKNKIEVILGFENRKHIFYGIHASYRFILIIIKKGGQTEEFLSTFMQRDISILNRIQNFESEVHGVDEDKDLEKLFEELDVDDLDYDDAGSDEDISDEMKNDEFEDDDTGTDEE